MNGFLEEILFPVNSKSRKHNKIKTIEVLDEIIAFKKTYSGSFVFKKLFQGTEFLYNVS